MDHVTMNHATLNGIASRANPPSGRRQTGAAAMADAPVAYPPYVPSTVEGFCRRAGKRSAPASASAAPRQRGAVLVVALIFLLLLSILAVSVMRSGQLEVLMAGNSQAQLSAFEFAEGFSEAILARWKNNLQTNEVVCTPVFKPTSTEPGFQCTKFAAGDLAWDARLHPATASLDAIKDATLYGRVRPLNGGKPACVPGFITGIAHGTWAFFFDVEASYDNSVSRQGASRVNHGAVLVNPVSSDCYANPQFGNLDKFAHVPTG
jgi:hypothetical protein